MNSAIKRTIFCALFAACLIPVAATPLRVCADPNNLPYSNLQLQGFENKIAELIAKDMGAQLTYYWYPQRGAFFKETLSEDMCDLVMGVPNGMQDLAVTQPYYRSSYVFISRRDRNLRISSLDDPQLRSLKIGVHVLGDQDDSLPPVRALISRGLVRNLVGFSIFGNLDEKDPPADLIKAVEARKVDVAIAWGPLAGYFSRHSAVPLEVAPIFGDPASPGLPFQFDIGIGVRKKDTDLQRALNAELVRLHPEIQQILRQYGIPEIDLATETARSAED
jgi:mxaJ protein